jgi:hypothetical protein
VRFVTSLEGFEVDSSFLHEYIKAKEKQAIKNKKFLEKILKLMGNKYLNNLKWIILLKTGYKVNYQIINKKI